MSDKYLDPSRWFDAVGTCKCGKAATGVVRGDRNQSMGNFCTACGIARVRKAARERLKASQSAKACEAK